MITFNNKFVIQSIFSGLNFAFEKILTIKKNAKRNEKEKFVFLNNNEVLHRKVKKGEDFVVFNVDCMYVCLFFAYV